MVFGYGKHSSTSSQDGTLGVVTPNQTALLHYADPSIDTPFLEPTGTTTEVKSGLHATLQNSTSGVSSPNGTVYDKLNRPNVRGSRWKEPAVMIVLYLLGVASALGNHFYFRYHVGRQVGSGGAQLMRIAIGTALTMLTVFLLGFANGIAFTQYAWTVLKKHAFTVTGIDSIFGIPGDPLAFMSLELMKKAKLVLFMAGIMWCMALCGIVPPGTLSVKPGLGKNVTDINVPNLKFDPVRKDPMEDNILFQSIVTTNITRVERTKVLKAAPQLQRIASTVAQTADLMHIPSTEPNITYEIKFTGPGLQCEPAKASQLEAFDSYAARWASETKKVYTAGSYQLRNSSATTPPKLSYLEFFSAFSPQLYSGFTDRVDNYGDVRPDGNPLIPNTPNGNQEIFLGVEFWILLANSSLVCSVTNASYDLGFNYTNGVAVVTQNNITHLHKVNNATADNTKTFNNYHGWAAALGGILYGNVTAFGEDCNITQADSTTKEGRCYHVSDASSRVMLTGLKDCDEFQHSWWEDNAGLFSLHETPVSPFVRDFSNQCRNKTLSRAIEDLAANLTISMLSFPSTAFRNLSSSEKVNAVLSRTINVYAYDAKSLLGSHGAAVGASLILIIIGLWSFYSNGTAHDIRFSSIVAATRSQDLDRISDRHSQELQKASKEKLIYGIADDVHIGNGKLTQKLSFGSKEKVIRLRKRQVF